MSSPDNPRRWGIMAIMGVALALTVGRDALAQPSPAAQAPLSPKQARLPADGEEWIVVRSEHLTLHANTMPERAELVALGLERLIAVVGTKRPGTGASVPLHATVYLFGNERSLRRYLRDTDGAPSELAGLFWSADEGLHVMLEASSLDQGLSIAHFSLVIQQMDRRFGELPPWFERGTGGVYTTFRTVGDTVEIGRPSPGFMRTLSIEGLLPMEELLAASAAPAFDARGGRTERFDATSWALVHYLTFGNAELVPRLPAFVDLLAAGAGPDEACQRALGIPVAQLNADVFRYLRIGQPRSTVLAVPAVDFDTNHVTKQLSRPMTLCVLGDTQATAHDGDLAVAEAHYRAALAIDPAFARARSGLGLVKDRQGLHDEAQAAHDAALATDPADVLVAFRWADSALARAERLRASSPEASATLAGAARDHFLRVATQDPRRAEALAKAGYACVLSGSTEPACIGALEKARRALPARLDLTVNLALLYARLGQRDRARPLFEQVAASRDPELQRLGREGLARMDAAPTPQ